MPCSRCELDCRDVVKHSFAARVLSKISTVTCYFNKSHAFKAKLKEESLRLKSNKETLDTIVVTRWTSVADCLRSFLVLRTPLQTITSMEKDHLPAKIVNIISHRTFFSDIKQFYSIMKALSYAVTIIQSRTATLGDCYLILTYLHAVTSNFPKQSDMIEFARYVSKVAKIRLDEFENPYYLACFYLHPKYRGAGLLAKSRAAVYRCIAEYSKLIGNSSSMTKSVIAALQRYELKAGPYALIYDKSDTPTTWWCLVLDVTHGNFLQQIALRLLSVTPHSVMPERLFPILDWQHSRRRNRQSPFTLDAIAKIHTYYKGKSCDSHSESSPIDETLGNDIHSEHDLVEHADDTADDLQRATKENQEILEKISQSKAIDTDPVNDDELLQTDSSVNTDDTDLRSIFIATGLFDRPENIESETDLSMPRKQQVEDDYDVDDLLKDVIIS